MMTENQAPTNIEDWSIQDVGLEKYKEFSAKMKNVFNKAEFLGVNKGKVDRVHCLVIRKGNSPRFAVSFGFKDGVVMCPFSASFSYPESLKQGQSIKNYEIAVRLINRYLDLIAPDIGTITLPPAYYDSHELETWIYLFRLHGWSIKNVDVDFAFCLDGLKENYEQVIAHNARKNLHIALRNNLKFRKIFGDEEIHTAYNIIALNRKSKNYALKMTEEQVIETMRILPADMFLVSDGTDYVASALVYEAAPKVGLVVYWGDVPGVADKRVMNYLPYMLLREYAKRGFKYLDIGPSTLEGKPNYGLCDYKDSIGCRRFSKIIFERRF